VHAGDKPPQEVLTPDLILNPVRQAFGGAIVLDPCAPSLTLAGRTRARIELINYTEADNGLEREWFDRTFINPPYADLKDWMATAAFWSGDFWPKLRMVQLIPVRPQRTWWWRALQGWDVIYLNSITFHGESNTFPAPVCLASHACEIPSLGAKETSRMLWQEKERTWKIAA